MVYIKTICPTCGEPVLSDLAISYEIPWGVVSRIVDVEVVDACTLQDLARSVIRELAGHIYDGITKTELCRILKDKFRILERHCCDIIQQIKLELGLYCKDGVHLNFVP